MRGIISLCRSTLLAEYLDRIGAASIPISDAEADELAARTGFVGSNDYMWFDAAGFKGGPAKLAAFLKKAHGGAPKVVHPVPAWLEDKLSRWNLQRHQVQSWLAHDFFCSL